MYQMLIFSTVVCPHCAPGIGGTMQIWEHAKKFLVLCIGVCAPQLQNCVGTYGWYITTVTTLSNKLFAHASTTNCPNSGNALQMEI